MGMLTSWLCSQQFLSGSSESSLQSCTAVHSAMGDAANVNDEGELKISGPLVFSCMKCRSIVGDSFSFMSSNEATRTITLAAASNINRTNDLFTSYESLDEGSTYFSVLCRECKETLGRYYVTTSSDLDDLREKFTFNIDAITSYELGKVQHGKRPEPAVLSFPVAEDAPSAAVTIEAVQEDVTKVRRNRPISTFVTILMFLYNFIAFLGAARAGGPCAAVRRVGARARGLATHPIRTGCRK